MYIFNTERPGGSVWPGGREEYLRECIKKSENDFRNPTKNDFICNAIAKANLPIRSGDVAGDERIPNTYEDLELAPYFPWMTLVLGSGCATETVDPTNLTPISPDAIARALCEYDGEGNFKTFYDDVRTFADNIIHDRLDRVTISKIRGNYNNHCGVETALLVAIAYILTDFYRRSSLSSVKPLARRIDDVIHIDKTLSHVSVELDTSHTNKLSDLVVGLLNLESGKGVREAEKGVVNRIKDTLSKGFLARLDVQILTEFAWLSMTEGCQIYHGWADMISVLAREQKHQSYPPFGYPPRPTYNALEASTVICGRYIDVTRASWSDRGKNIASMRHKFFDAAAEVLAGQSKLRRKRFSRIRNVPVATAFSTSFDLELEMALAHRDDIESGFTVVLPVYYVEESSGKASLQWLGADIPPRPEVDDILCPKDGCWRLLSGIPWNDESDNAVKPYVIHLAGTPLISPPKLEEAPKLDGSGVGITFSDLVPAILLNEYEAIQHHGTEMFQASTGEGKSGSQRESSAGLPDEFTAASDMIAARFWLIMGVQMDDPAVRYKLATRLGPGRNGRNAGTKFAAPDKAGLVVTSKLDPAAKDLLGWYGVDMVVGACTRFQRDLKHYARHLEEHNVHTVCEHYKKCEVANAES